MDGIEGISGKEQCKAAREIAMSKEEQGVDELVEWKGKPEKPGKREVEGAKYMHIRMDSGRGQSQKRLTGVPTDK